MTAPIPGAKATIVAIATPPGGAERGVVRGSGPGAGGLLVAAWTDAANRPFDAAASRGAYEGRFDDAHGGVPARLYWMPGPRSFTREDVFELHLAGSPFLLTAVLSRLLELGAKLAEPGEFTRRAFLSGRIDLSRAEGILALVEARNESERRAATMLLAGGLEKRMDALRETLDTTRALCEASLDFDETDTGHVPEEELRAGAKAARDQLLEAQRWEQDRTPESGLPRVVLAGLPNAGKSELFNRLAGAEAIVAPVAGTTRDTLRGEWSLPGGSRCLLSDTAGEEKLTGTESELERLRAAAQQVASRERENAEALLWVLDARTGAVDSEENGTLTRAAKRSPVVLAWNQVDRSGAPVEPPPEVIARWRDAGILYWVATSGRSGEGLHDLGVAMGQALLGGVEGEAAAPNLERELGARHGEALRVSAERIEEALVALDHGAPLEVFAEELRQASEELDAITGRTVTERLLDRIFARFCLGK